MLRRWVLVPAWVVLGALIVYTASVQADDILLRRLTQNEVDTYATVVGVHRGLFGMRTVRVAFDDADGTVGATLHTQSPDSHKWVAGAVIPISYNSRHPSAVVFYADSGYINDTRDNLFDLSDSLAVLIAMGALISLAGRLRRRSQYRRRIAKSRDVLPATFLATVRAHGVTRVHLEIPIPRTLYRWDEAARSVRIMGHSYTSPLHVRLLGRQDREAFVPGQMVGVYGRGDRTGPVMLAGPRAETVLLGLARRATTPRFEGHYQPGPPPDGPDVGPYQPRDQVERAGAPPPTRLRSRRWKLAAVLFLPAGMLITLMGSAATMAIDGTAGAQAWSTPQVGVATATVVVGVCGVVLSGLVTVRLWMRPALRTGPDAVSIFTYRPVAVPWPMIAAVVSGRAHSDGDDRRPGLVLVNGAFVPARCLRRFEGSLGGAAAVPLVDARTPSRQGLEEGGEWWPARANAGDLPGPPRVQVRDHFRWSIFGPVLAAPYVLGFLLLIPDPRGIDVGGAVTFALILGVVASVVTWGCWVSLTRTVAVGDGWVAWRPRFVAGWRILQFAELVSTIDMRWPKRSGVRLSRADGTGVHLRPRELASGLRRPLVDQLAEHPATCPASWMEEPA